MRVLQLIDTLEAGGAERMAVNLANALTGEIEISYLCSSRLGGILEKSINSNVKYLYLNKKGTLDIKAFYRFYIFLKKEKIDIIHAHSSSFFLASLVAVLNNRVKVIWHDHYGNSKFVSKRPKRVLQFCSRFFAHSFAVNSALMKWAKSNLKNKSVSYLPNFISLSSSDHLLTELKGSTGYRIVCLANLRPQKDHSNLLRAFNSIEKDFPKYTVHCIGQDFNDVYSKQIYDLNSSLNLSSKVYFYGSCSDISAILLACDIGVLASKSEGLPLALLEYGQAELPVVVTNVGDCDKVVSDGYSGYLVSPEQPEELSNALSKLIINKEEAKIMGLNLKRQIADKFSNSSVIKIVLEQYQSI